MKKKLLILLLAILLIAVFTSCTENIRAKQYGGSMTIIVPEGNKVENITWKQGDLWYSYRPFEEGEKPKKHIFVEKSSFGTWEGKIIFIESMPPKP